MMNSLFRSEFSNWSTIFFVFFSQVTMPPRMTSEGL